MKKKSRPPVITMAAQINVMFRVGYPVSANEYKRPRVLPGGGVMFYLTKEAEAFRAEVGWAAKGAGCRVATSLPVTVDLTLLPRMNADGSASAVVLDVGNVEKVALDALQGVAYGNDRQVRRLVVDYGEPVEGGGLVIVVRTFEAPEGPLFTKGSSDARL